MIKDKKGTEVIVDLIDFELIETIGAGGKFFFNFQSSMNYFLIHLL